MKSIDIPKLVANHIPPKKTSHVLGVKTQKCRYSQGFWLTIRPERWSFQLCIREATLWRPDAAHLFRCVPVRSMVQLCRVFFLGGSNFTAKGDRLNRDHPKGWHGRQTYIHSLNFWKKNVNREPDVSLKSISMNAGRILHQSKPATEKITNQLHPITRWDLMADLVYTPPEAAPPKRSQISSSA